MNRIEDCNSCGLEFCDVIRSLYPKFRDNPSPRQKMVIVYGCKAWKPRPDIGKKLGYLSDARHNLEG